jgi:hypothetical protein
MAFSPKEQQILKWGQQNGKSRQEVEQALFAFRSGVQPKATAPVATEAEQGPSIPSRVAGSFGRAFQSGAEAITQEVGEAGERFEQAPDTAVGTFVEKPAILLNTLFRAAGTTAKTAFTPLGEALATGVEKTADFFSDIPEVQKFANDERVSGALDNVIGGLAQAGDNYEQFKTTNPQAAKDLEAGAEILFTVLGEKATTDILSRTVSLIDDVATKARNIELPSVPNMQTPTIKPPQLPPSITQRVNAKRETIGTNIEARRAKEQSIRELPTETAQIAARQGVDVNDIKEVQSFFDDPVTSQTDKAMFRELVDTAKAYSERGKRGTNPIEVVGKPVVERFQNLEKQRNQIGRELGETADNLGNVTVDELQPVVFAQLQRVNGLEGLRIADNGKLDFSNTSIGTKLSKSDQRAVQEAYEEAIKSGAGKQKHLLRQELFEILGGKKMSQTPITGTQERAFNAIRQGLSEVLESKNADYKSLSNEYRKVINPLTEARKLLRENKIEGESGANADLLDLRAGIIMRRLTGTGSSGPEVEALLRELDAVGRELGESAVSTRNLQEFYNILNRYYDLAPSTGFQNQIREGFGGGGGVIDRILRTVTGTADETPDVRQKALEKLLDELLSD